MTENLKSQLDSTLKELRLPAMRSSYEDFARSAQSSAISYEKYLFDLAEHELDNRRRATRERYLRESKLPLEKTMDTFDMKRLPKKLQTHVGALLDGTFLDRNENVLAFGNPGSGKTHLLCAISQELIHKGRRIYFTPCSFLVQKLLAAKSELTLAKMLKSLSRYDAIFIDDIGYVQQSRDEMEVLFTLLADRYERASILITSNLPFSKWEQIFKDPVTASAAIDRLVHHSVILELNLPSYRMEKAQQSKSAA